MMRCAAMLLLAAVAVAAADAPRLTYSKSFPGSNPPWFQISVDKSGAGEYKEDPKDDDPLKFQLTAAESAQVFGLADKLDRFSHPLESGLKVANMGIKTFRYEADGHAGEVKFNYSQNADARALADWFDNVMQTERSLIGLENAVHYDRLGVQDAILRVEILRDQNSLIAPAQFLPTLDRIAKNESFLHMARERAANLADWIRARPK